MHSSAKDARHKGLRIRCMSSVAAICRCGETAFLSRRNVVAVHHPIQILLALLGGGATMMHAGRFGEPAGFSPCMTLWVSLRAGLSSFPTSSLRQRKQFSASVSIERVHFERRKTPIDRQNPPRASEGGTKMATATHGSTGDVNVKAPIDRPETGEIRSDSACVAEVYTVRRFPKPSVCGKGG